MKLLLIDYEVPTTSLSALQSILASNTGRHIVLLSAKIVS